VGTVFAFRGRPGKAPCAEGGLKRAILQRLEWYPDLKVFCNAQGGRTYRTGLGPGSSDIIGVLAPIGRFFALEVKVPGKDLMAVQVEWMDQIRKLGGFAAVVHSPEEADEAYKRARAGLLG